MKRNVIVFGLIAGAIVTLFMVLSIAKCYKQADFGGSMILGYASMLLAFSFIFVGVKNYRDQYNNGILTFGKGFMIGLYISLIASSLYVLVWLIDYYIFIPDFMDKYTAHVLLETKKGGALPAKIAEKAKEMANFKEMYKNPLLIIVITYAEILPIGLIISLISALIMKRKSK